MKEIKKQEDQIVDIDGYVHIINGVVICFNQNIFDLSKQKDMNHLIELSKDVKSRPEKYSYKNDTVLCFSILDDTAANDVIPFTEEELNRMCSSSEEKQEYLEGKINGIPMNELPYLDDGSLSVYLEHLPKETSEKIKKALNEYENKTRN